MQHRGLIFAFVITFCLVFGVFSNALAQYNLSLQLTSDGSAEATEFARGDDLYLNIILDNAGGVAGCAFSLEYETDVLTAPATNADGTPLSAGEITSIFPFTYNSTATHRENSSEPGKIYFSGAEIDTTDGGAKYESGEIVLFTVKFTVKGDAPFDFINLSLTQTQLFNPAAGWGTDGDGDGVYDQGDGDTYDPVPVLVGAVDNQDPNWDDLSQAFPVLLGDDTNPFTEVTYNVCEVVPEPTYTIAGTISYTGRQTGTIYVGAFDGPDPDTANKISCTPISQPGAFTIEGLPNGTYYIGAYRDSDGEVTSPDVMDRDPTEAQGMYTDPGNPTAVPVSGANVTGKNFTIYDPDSDSDDMPDWWENAHDLNPSDSSDAGTDADQDGYLNLYEYQNDTNPTVQDDAYTYANYNPATDNRGPYQIVSTNPSAPKAGAGATFGIDVNYTTSDNNANLTGLGLRIHYDSSKLQFVEFDNVLSEPVLTVGPPLEKAEDVDDGDENTDRVLVIAWSDAFDVSWPGQLPVRLCTVRFTADQSLQDGDTSVIRYTGSPALGYQFHGAPVTFEVQSFNLDIDGNGIADALSDGILIIRYLFGLTEGPSLVQGVVDTVNGTRTTDTEIGAYIDVGRNGLILDIDGNGNADALSDGILIIRYLFGLTEGPSLVQGVVDTVNGTRTIDTEIGVYIEQIKP